ncbi:PP2C family protein-serine/threonine phosphatase [Streptomyces sp. MI02-2A]|uniref:PP2C family protein-serine/threonine phosphatase n=1 Tax=unclassified Streptomyces TaxID=2593676 RepID=UPI000E265946|nr:MULTISPECIES: PP2C family protein-serine/threonine phosphatase [unclassified Streptomyces]MDX3264716.1 PP2C family protein-serine/threonine phosphatase [Streptomyces sp. MI02-2A]
MLPAIYASLISGWPFFYAGIRRKPKQTPGSGGTLTPLPGTQPTCPDCALTASRPSRWCRYWPPAKALHAGSFHLSLGRPDPQTVHCITEAAHALAYVVIVNRRFTDLYEWGRCTTRLSLAAEIQHRLLPDSFTCNAGRFTVAGALEPAADIGGDTFDYTLDRRSLHLSLTDAMGHDVQAALLATMVVGALRNARRAGAGLASQAKDAHRAVARYANQAHLVDSDRSDQVHEAIAEYGGQAMVTGQLLRVALDTGHTAVVNAGHIWPLRLRDGKVEEIALFVDLPFGVTPNPGYRVQSLDLRPGDRLVLLTDGMLEPHGTDCGLRSLIEQTGDWHPRDAVRVFTDAVLQATNHDPRDDATVLCLDWPGP